MIVKTGHSRRGMLKGLLTGIAASAATVQAGAGYQAGSAHKTGGVGEESSSRDTSVLFSWSLRVVRRVVIASGPPRYIALSGKSRFRKLLP